MEREQTSRVCKIVNGKRNGLSFDKGRAHTARKENQKKKKKGEYSLIQGAIQGIATSINFFNK